MPTEFELGAEQLGIGVDEGGAVALEEFGGRELAAPLGELGLVIEQFEVTGTAVVENQEARADLWIDRSAWNMRPRHTGPTSIR